MNRFFFGVLLSVAAARELQAQGVTLSTDAVTVNEGATATFTVKLTADPGAPVSVGVNTTIGLASVSAAPPSLGFDSTNWNVDHVVTVSAPADGDDVDNGATIALTLGPRELAKVIVTSVDTMPAPVPDRPSVRISLPRNGDVVSGSRAEFFGSPFPAGGAATVQGEFFIDGVLVYTDPGPGHYHINGGHGAWNTLGLTDGPHVLRLTVTDDAVPARTGTHEITVLVDNQPGGAGSGGGGSSSCGLLGLETLILYPLFRAFQRRKWGP